MRCKEPVRVTLSWPEGRTVIKGHIHRAGCAGARYTHIDIEPVGPLAELAAIRGMRLYCRQDGDAILLIENIAGIQVRVSVQGYTLSCPGRLAYIMRTKSGKVYLRVEVDRRRKNA